MIAFLAAVTIALAPQAPPRPQWTKGSDVVLNDTIEAKVDALASRYAKKKRRPLHITSGARSPARQALAMYAKLRVGGSLGIYARQDLVGPIRDAYRQGRKKRWGKDRTVNAMAKVIREQVEAGHYLSRHLSGRAFDIRSLGLTRRDRQALAEAVRQVGGLHMIEEKKPPHFHLEVTD